MAIAIADGRLVHQINGLILHLLLVLLLLISHSLLLLTLRIHMHSILLSLRLLLLVCLRILDVLLRLIDNAASIIIIRIDLMGWLLYSWAAHNLKVLKKSNGIISYITVPSIFRPDHAKVYRIHMLLSLELRLSG